MSSAAVSVAAPRSAHPYASRPLEQAGTAALVALVACGGAIALTGASTRLLVPAGSLDRPLPGWIAGPLAGIAPPVSTTQFAALGIAMVLLYVVVLLRAATIPVRAGIAAIVILHVLFALAPPLLSTDVFTYLANGRLHVVHDLNPYVLGPSAAPRDALYPWIGSVWRDTPTVYGPAFTLLCSALAPLGPATGLWVLKGLTALASLGCVALVWSCARRLGRSPLKAALVVGLNPLLLVTAVGGAHNDLLMALGVLGAIRLLLDRREALAATSLVAAVAVKLSAGLLLPFLVVGARRGARGVVVVAAALAAVAVGVVGFAAFGTGPLDVVSSLSVGAARHIGEFKSVPGFIAQAVDAGLLTATDRSVLRWVFLAVSAAAWLWAWRRPAPARWLTAAGVSMGALLVTSPTLQPWYVVWLLPLAALSTNRRVRVSGVALTLLVVGIEAARWFAPFGVPYPHAG